MVSSTMLPLGTAAPDFAIADVVTGDPLTLATFADKAALGVRFICQHCPFVKHVQAELARLGQDYGPQNVGLLAVSANSVQTHPQDAPDRLKDMALTLGFNFPYGYDETQAMAKAYTAACTPDFFVFDGDRRLVYRGQLDDSRPGNDIPVTGKDVRAAIAAVLAHQPVSPTQKPSIGCNIKWTPGNEPAYFGS
ncbi:MAG TPA: thioredoxin family protein [Candidatus Obscuribacterales bacterium]